MAQIGVGLSRNPNSLSAVEEALQGAYTHAELVQVDWGLVFFTAPHLPQAEEIRSQLMAETGCRMISGCSGAGVLTNEGEITGAPALAVMLAHTPGLNPLAFAKYQELPDSASVNQQLKETLERFHNDPLVFLFPDVYRNQPFNFINTMNYAKTRPVVFGAGACDDGSLQESVQFGPDGTVKCGAGGLALTGIPRYRVGVTQSCVPLGDPMFITEVKDNLIVRLDDHPALEVFVTVGSELGLTSLETAAHHLLLSFPLDLEKPKFTADAALVRNLTGIDVPSQGLEVPQLLQEGMVVSFAYRSPITAEQDLYGMLERIKTEEPEPPAFGVYFNCAARGEALYGRPDVDTEVIREILGEFPLIGFFGGYELARVPAGLQLYSYTGVLVLVYL